MQWNLMQWNLQIKPIVPRYQPTSRSTVHAHARTRTHTHTHTHTHIHTHRKRDKNIRMRNLGYTVVSKLPLYAHLLLCHPSPCCCHPSTSPARWSQRWTYWRSGLASHRGVEGEQLNGDRNDQNAYNDACVVSDIVQHLLYSSLVPRLSTRLDCT